VKWENETRMVTSMQVGFLATVIWQYLRFRSGSFVGEIDNLDVNAMEIRLCHQR